MMPLMRNWDGGQYFELFADNSNDCGLGSASGGQHPTKGRILLVNGHFLVLKALQYLVAAWGYEPLAASGEAEALELVQRAGVSPDLIVADCRIGDGLTGARAIASLRRHFSSAVPAILITDVMAPVQLRKTEMIGLRLLRYPLQGGQLLDVIEALLGK
jgi:CheY-like chemotaxis protein